MNPPRKYDSQRLLGHLLRIILALYFGRSRSRPQPIDKRWLPGIRIDAVTRSLEYMSIGYHLGNIDHAGLHI